MNSPISEAGTNACEGSCDREVFETGNVKRIMDVTQFIFRPVYDRYADSKGFKVLKSHDGIAITGKKNCHQAM